MERAREGRVKKAFSKGNAFLFVPACLWLKMRAGYNIRIRLFLVYEVGLPHENNSQRSKICLPYETRWA